MRRSMARLRAFAIVLLLPALDKARSASAAARLALDGVPAAIMRAQRTSFSRILGVTSDI